MSAAELDDGRGRRLSDREIAQVAHRAGFRGRGLVTAVAVALAESGGRTDARCWNRRRADGRVTCTRERRPDSLSADRGLWQINSRAHPDVSDECADSPSCAARAAWRISRGGTHWRPWVTHWRGTAARHMARAERAVAGL